MWLSVSWSRRTRRRIAELTAEHPSKSVEQITTDVDGDRWCTAPEGVAYDVATEVIGGIEEEENHHTAPTPHRLKIKIARVR